MEYPPNHNDRYQVGKCEPWRESPLAPHPYTPSYLDAYHPTRGAAAKLAFMREYVLNRARAVGEDLDGIGVVEEALAAWTYIMEATKVD